MGIKRYKPKTPGLRFLVAIDRSKLWKGRPLKKLTESVKSSGGRNNHGHITVRNRGGGHKKLYRIIDFKRKLDEHKAIVERIEYDPNRTCFIALIKYNNGIQRYILAPKGIKKGDQVESGEVVPVKDGNCMEIGNMPDGAIVHNVELSPGKGGDLARSAGSSAQVIGKAGGFVQVKLPSGEIRKVLSKCRATCGMLSNEDNKNVILGKAGRARWKGNRPRVRGVAMNPVDHPLGGGEGKTSGGRHPVSYSGVPSKGKKTRSKKKSNKMIIRRRK